MTPNEEYQRAKVLIDDARRSQATKLDLSGLGLAKLPDAIANLTNLQELYLSDNQLSRLPDAITKLTNLRSLDLRNNQLSRLPDAIANLTNLQSLWFSSNQLSNLPDAITNLTHLQELNLSNNQLSSLPEGITNLIQLRDLNLSNNQLSSLPDTIANLTHLQELNLSNNQLSSLPDAIANLTNLQGLYLSSNQLSSLPDAIANLTNLQGLYLSGNQLSSLPNAIANLTNLQRLYLNDNQLSSLPDAIANLTSLQRLYLNTNKLSSLPNAITNLSHLQRIDLGRNLLSHLPDAIFHLHNLVELDLGSWHTIPDHHRINKLPDSIGNLTNLRRLELEQNQLSSLPDAIGLLSNLEYLGVENNPLDIPPEIIKNNRNIIAYYRAIIDSQKRPLNEAKVLLVGQGTVGKTSLVQRLLNQGFNPHEPKTDGIAIQTLDITLEPDSPEPRIVKLHLWDFGGQEIMHATHQFFLTKRSLYLLVLNNRQSEEENRLEYWLNTIESFGSDSPVIIVGNQSDQHPLDLDERGLRKKYPNIKAFIATSCQDGTGIEQLQQTINREINQLKHVSDPLPGHWFQVKEVLENLEKDYIPYDDYTQICQANQIPEDHTQRILVSLLHDLGIVLNFYDDPLVCDTHVINPEWVTTAIYKIINDPTLMTEDKGILTYRRLNQILPKPAYPNHKHQFIIAMMKKFELCFAINDQQVLIPNLLPKEAPATLNSNNWNSALRFQYHYAILPQSVISRFIVKMHQRIDAQTYWRSGVVLISEGNRAQITADLYDKKIFIAINGTAHTRRDFLSEIRGCFFSIHDSFARLPVEEKVPLPTNPEIVVSFQHLLDLEEIGEETFVPEGTKEKVKVRELLNGVGKTITPFNKPKANPMSRNLVFISYSHQDAELKEELLLHLAPFRRQNLLKIWEDTQIKTGDKWRDEINKALAAAKVAVLLVSPYFLASQFIQDNELPPLLDAAEKEGLTIFWIPISASNYKKEAIEQYQSAHPPNDPLDVLNRPVRNQAWVSICQKIEIAMND